MLIFERLVFISIFCLYIDKSDYYVTGIVAFAIYYLWGRDLSGTLYGAGGVGGLLAMKKNNVWYFPFYDNNGNVTAYVDMNGNSVATYEYDAFGQMISQSGVMANQFSHRFSTKYFDSETSLHYYGYRFYSPNLCRWLNRDPIEENGGNNLYVGCRNDFINAFDLLGMKNYYSGTEDPLHISDEGAGAWNSESKDLASLMQFAAIRLAINTAFAKYGLPDASAHLDYYFSRRGGVYKIRLEEMIRDSTRAKKTYQEELDEAKRYVESLPNGRHTFTSANLSLGDNDNNLNWDNARILSVNSYRFMISF